jgi:hypothetical protein
MASEVVTQAQVPVEESTPIPPGRSSDPLVRIGIVILVIFLGYKVVPFYYYYFDIQSNCAQVVRNAAVQSDEELRRNLLEVVRRNGIEKEARDIGIQRIGGRIKIWLNYQEDLDISLMGRSFTLYRFDFTPTAEGVYDE